MRADNTRTFTGAETASQPDESVTETVYDPVVDTAMRRDDCPDDQR
jgi:hypothetical protein